MLLSEQHRKLMKGRKRRITFLSFLFFSSLFAGVEKSDSVAWCAHKMIGAPLHASVTLFRDGDALRAGFDCFTPYIFQV